MLMTQPEADGASNPHSRAMHPGAPGAGDDAPHSRAPRPEPPHAGQSGLPGDADEPPMDIGILVTIRSLLPNLAPVERRVAQAVLDDPGGAARRSISELARSCGTSATSVVRFCRAIGLRGYPDLRLALAGAVARDHVTTVAAASHDIGPDDDAAAITSKIAYADARAVTDTASHLAIAILV